MKRETIKNIFDFLKEKEGKQLPKKWIKIKLIHELENHPDGTQCIYYDHLDLSGTNITKLPNDLYVDGRLILETCKQLTELPNKLHVEDGLSLWDCNQITELPNKLHVGDDLSLCGTNITTLPDNLYVGGYLDIYNTPIAKKYSNEEIREMITSKGGILIGKISR